MEIKPLITGENLPFNAETNETDIINRLGQPSEIEEYGKFGRFLHYDNLRFSTFNKNLTGIDLFLINSNKSYEFPYDEDIFVINNKTPLLQILFLFNRIGLEWNIPYNNSKHDYLVIENGSNLKVFYYYEKMVLERISRFFQT